MGQAENAVARLRKSALPEVISGHRLVNFAHRHLISLLTGLYICHLLAGTLIPFDFSLSAAFHKPRTWLGLGDTPSGLPDLLSNIALFIPLGLLLHWSMARVSRRPWISLIATVTIAATISLAIESIQLLSATRTSSLADLTANLIGTTVGAAASLVSRRPERHLLASLAHQFRHRPMVASIKIYTVLLVLAGLLPFTPTFDVTRVRDSVRSTTMRPLEQDQTLATQYEQARDQGDLLQASTVQRDRMMLWARWLAEWASFVVFGWLLYRLLREHYRFGLAGATVLLVYLTTGLAVLLSGLQLFVMSRGFHLGDVLVRVFGGVTGYLAIEIVAGHWHSRTSSPGQHLWQRLAPTALVLALLLALLTGLAPFVFEFDSAFATAKLISPHFKPFYSYYVGRFDRVCADFWAKTLIYSFVAIAWWWYFNRRTQRPQQIHLIRIFTLVVSMALAIETAQLFLWTRTSSVTDVIIAALMAVLAPLAAQYLADLYYHSMTLTKARPTTSQESAPRWSPTDRLIATLIPDPQEEHRPTSAP